MSWTVTASGSVGGTGSTNAITVSGLTTTNANVIYVAVAGYRGSNFLAGDLVDNQSNVWTVAVQQQSSGDANCQIGIYYKISPATAGGGGHSFTYTPGGGQYPAMVVWAFQQGSAPTFNTTVSVGTGANTSQPGSIGNANDLVFTAGAFYLNPGPITGGSIDSAFATPIEVGYSNSNHIGVIASWKEIASATNPTWTWGGGGGMSGYASASAANTGVGGGGGGFKGTPLNALRAGWGNL